MSEQQALEFVLGGGMEDGCTTDERALQRSTERLKHLLLVRGRWRAGMGGQGGLRESPLRSLIGAAQFSCDPPFIKAPFRH